LQFLIFRQDAPLNLSQLSNWPQRPYRASGLVLWHFSDMARCPT
jgi:hypothetical protein